jgi:hypothetical protein
MLVKHLRLLSTWKTLSSRLMLQCIAALVNSVAEERYWTILATGRTDLWIVEVESDLEHGENYVQRRLNYSSNAVTFSSTVRRNVDCIVHNTAGAKYWKYQASTLLFVPLADINDSAGKYSNTVNSQSLWQREITTTSTPIRLVQTPAPRIDNAHCLVIRSSLTQTLRQWGFSWVFK